MKKRVKILFIAPLPPPVTGQSIVSKSLLEGLSKNNEVIVIDYSRKGINPKAGFNIMQLFKSVKLANLIKQNSKSTDLLYITLSMSCFGNLKDLYFLFKAGNRLRKKAVIHIHSGGFDRFYKNLFFINKMLNKYFLSNVHTGIVLGKSLKKCLLPILPEKKIEYVSNFFSEKLLLSINNINKKWDNIQKFNLLFLSNFIKEKGYMDFFKGFDNLPEKYKDKCNIIFAGKFYKKNDKKLFLRKISKYKNIKYYDFIENEKKQEILYKSHALFLPTYYKIEGQPICILESYASGLTVFTSDQGGIKDIFTNKINGEFLVKRSPISVKDAIISLIERPERFKKYAINNREIAERYSKKNFITKMKGIFSSIS